MLNQRKIYPFSRLLQEHYFYYHGNFLGQGSFEILPHSIFFFMPFFQKPLYDRTLIKFSEKSETILIEIGFPGMWKLEENFIPLFGDRFGVKDTFGDFHYFSENTYDNLVSRIAVGIDRSIADRKKFLSSQKRGDEDYFADTEENSLNLNHGIIEGSNRYSSIWDINDFIKFFYAKNKGLNLQNLCPPKNYKLPLSSMSDPHYGYTKFIKNHYGSSKFVIKLKGFSKKELSYLRRFFSFDLKKYIRKKNFKFDSSKIEINYHQHSFFMGEHEHNDPTLPSDFIEKLLWWFDFENKSFDPKTSVTVETLEESGSFYFFPDKKLIQVNDLSKGKYIPPPKDFIFDDQDILGKNIELGHLQMMVKAGVFGNNIDEYGNEVDPVRDCFEKLYFYDWNLGIGFPGQIRDKIFEQIKIRMEDARSSLKKEYLKQIGSPYLNYNDLKTAMFKSESFNNTNKFLKICAEFFMKYNIRTTVYTSRETETEVLNLKQFINNPEFLKLNRLPAKLKTLINTEDESTNGFVDFCMDLSLDDFTEDLNLELYFWSDSSKTRDLFLEMINGEFSIRNDDFSYYAGYEDKETRFILKIEKFDLYKVWIYLSLLEERRLFETYDKYCSITKKPIDFQSWKKRKR